MYVSSQSPVCHCGGVWALLGELRNTVRLDLEVVEVRELRSSIREFLLVAPAVRYWEIVGKNQYCRLDQLLQGLVHIFGPAHEPFRNVLLDDLRSMSKEKWHWLGLELEILLCGKYLDSFFIFQLGFSLLGHETVSN